MAGELVAQLSAAEAMRETPVGYNPWSDSVLSNDLRGLRLNKLDTAGYNWVVGIQPGITMGTSLVFKFVVVDNGEFSSDLGLVARLGITVKRLINGETTDLDAAAGAEQFGTVTLASTSGQVAVASVTIAVANLDSAAVGDFIAVRIRRNGSNAADTAQGSIILLGTVVTNT